jgi:hypothetical protein
MALILLFFLYLGYLKPVKLNENACIGGRAIYYTLFVPVSEICARKASVPLG